MSLAETIAQGIYQRSSDPSAPENAGADWQAGYAVGRYTQGNPLNAIEREWCKRGNPSCADGTPFAEWKQGMWSGRFAQTDARLRLTGEVQS
jgi:hypothetical protein